MLNGNGATSYLYSKEGVTKGKPLAIFAYSIGILLLIKQLNPKFSDVTQPWYADNAVSLGMFAIVKLYFNFLKLFGPEQWYYPEPSKCNFNMHPENIKARKRFGLCCRFKVCTFARYLGGSNGDDKFKRDWLKEYTEMWEKNIHKISRTAG